MCGHSVGELVERIGTMGTMVSGDAAVAAARTAYVNVTAGTAVVRLAAGDGPAVAREALRLCVGDVSGWVTTIVRPGGYGSTYVTFQHIG